MSQTTSPVEMPKMRDGQDSFLPLLVALIAMLVMAPLAEPLPLLAFVVVAAAQLAGLLAGLFAVWHNRSFRITVIGGLAICLPLRLLVHWFGDQHSVLILLSHIAAGAYFAIFSAVRARVPKPIRPHSPSPASD